NFQGTATIQVLASGTWTDTLGNPGLASNTVLITEDTRALLIDKTVFLQDLEAQGIIINGFLTVPTIVNNGTIVASTAQTWTITGDITGTGTIEIKNNSTVMREGSVGSGQRVEFSVDPGAGANGVLVVKDLPDFHATQISNFQGHEQIDLLNIDPAQIQYPNPILTIPATTTPLT